MSSSGMEALPGSASLRGSVTRYYFLRKKTSDNFALSQTSKVPGTFHTVFTVALVGETLRLFDIRSKNLLVVSVCCWKLCKSRGMYSRKTRIHQR